MIRKMVRIGNSEGIIIPVGIVRSHKLNIGDEVEVYIGRPGSEPKYLELLKELESFNKDFGKALEHLGKKVE